MNATTWPPTPSLHELIDLSGRVALVTGGARGLGYGCARRLAEAGAAVVLLGRDEERIEGAAARLREAGASAIAVSGDVTRDGDPERAVEAAVRELGRLDVLVNNAGIFSNHVLAELEPAELHRVLAVNVEGAHRCTRASVAQMRRQGGGGSIVMMTSIDAVHPTSVGLAHYTTSKHALWGYTKAMALELGRDGIRVNALAPGPSITEGIVEYFQEFGDDEVDVDAQWATTAERVPLRRWADPDEVGRICVFLASRLASHVTGAQIVVDGGYLVG
jgi:NAD(P)-dependent dehydrogenase (short-subunit alcohol dehydrogenase family)